MSHATSCNAHPLARFDAGNRFGILGDEPLLTALQEHGLADAVRHGDRPAAHRLARANLRLVVAIARSYQGHGLDLDDLVGEGNLGLLRAVDDYDPGRSTRFSTYAAVWVRQAIRAALTNTSRAVRIPAHVVKTLGKWRRVEQQLTNEGYEAPSFDQVADRLTLTDSCREMVKQARRVSFSGGERGVNEGTLADAVSPGEGPGEALDRVDAACDLRARIAMRLDPREREVLTLRFGLDSGEPVTMSEAGGRLGITREWVRRIEIRAVKKLGDMG